MKDQEMLNELIMESREHLENIEPDLLELEEKGNDVSDELINRVFRAVHSIKGGFGFFGIENIVTLSHAMENVMSRIRDKEITVTPELTDALLQGIDKVRILLDDVTNSGEVSISTEINALSPFLDLNITDNSQEKAIDTDSVIPIDPSSEINKVHPDLNDEHHLDAVRNGKYMYQVIVDPQKDVIQKKSNFKQLFIDWDKFGTIVVSNPPQLQLEKQEVTLETISEVSIIIATVLESDLISEAINIPQEQIYSIDLTVYKNLLLEEQDKVETKEQSAGIQKLIKMRNEKKQDNSRIEDALRVKVGLLNNLMNFAGELVLGRNQLIQTMNRKLSESYELEKIGKNYSEFIRQSMLKIITDDHLNKQHKQQNIDTEITQLEAKLKDLFNFQLRDVLGVNSIIQNINMVTTLLQESIMQTRMQPISVVFSKFPRVIRDLAKKLGKEITLTQIGQDVELDKSIIELLSDPLTHLIRNCADHAIEKPSVRKKRGKSPKGEVILKAFQEGGKVIIEISDDGAGIDPEVIKARALDKNIITKDEAEQMSQKELQMLIFTPGFSTVQLISDVSGRGVGMDVVKTNIERLGGNIEIESEVEKGTKIYLKLPLTLAIIPSLIVTVENRRFAVPQVGLEEVVRIRASDVTKRIERVHNSEVLRLRGKLLPLVRLATALGLTPTYINPETNEKRNDRRTQLSDRRKQDNRKTNEENCTIFTDDEKRNGVEERRINSVNAVKVVVLRMDKKLYGLVVEDVQDSEEIVVKPLPEYLKSSVCYAGATIMGDGKVAMILDPNGIAIMADLKFDDIEKEVSSEKKQPEKGKDNLLQNLLLFSIGGPEHFAIDLSSVSRIEKRKVEEIELIGNKEFLKYESSSLRLFRIENYIPVQPSMESPDTIFVIVPKNAQYPLGFVTARVEDTIETELKIDSESVKGTGVRGAAIINKKMTVIIDVPELIHTLETEIKM